MTELHIGWRTLKWGGAQRNAGRPRQYQTSAEKREHCLEMSRQRRHAKRGVYDPNGPVQKSEPPPAAIVREYADALTRPRTLTAEQFGDPLPGRSALDKMRMHHDAP